MNSTWSDRTRLAGLGVLLLAITVLAYLPALDAQFIWDDDNYVTANPTLWTPGGLWRIWFEPGATPQYYPLTFTTFWVEYRLWQLDPFGYHLVNILLHGLSALLFWQVLRLLGLPGAWLAGAIFALHPMNVESVAWITERKNVLSGACYLGAALAYLRFSPPQEEAAGGRWGWYAVAIVWFICALLSKTVTSSLPAALLLVLWWKRGRVLQRDLVALAPFFAIGLAAAAMTVWMERSHVGAQGEEWAFSLVERGLIAGRVLWFYPWTLIWPSNLTFIYPRWRIDAAIWWQYLFPAAAVLLVGTLFALRRRLGTGPLIAVLFYAGTLVPALGFFNVYPMRYSFVADHFAYLPILGLIALFAALSVKLLEHQRAEASTKQVLAGALLFVLAALSWQQGKIYEDPETLWADTVAKNPGGWAVQVNLGGVYANQGKLDEAIAHMETAQQLWPKSPEIHNALGAMWEQQGELDRAEEMFKEALRLEPRYYESHTNLGIVLSSQGKLEEAQTHLSIATRLKPQYVEAHYYLGSTLLQLDRPTEAARSFATALLLVPDYHGAHNGLCAALKDRRAGDAERHCREAIRLNQRYPEAYENLARVLQAQGRREEARASEEAAQRLRHEMVDGLRNTGVSLVEQGRPRAATAYFVEALRLKPDDTVAQARLQQLRAGES